MFITNVVLLTIITELPFQSFSWGQEWQDMRKAVYLAVFKFFFMVGEVSPYVSTPRFARVCHYPLRGDTPRRPVQFFGETRLCGCPALVSPF